MKVINKRQLVAHKADVRTEWLARERRALCELDHPFIVRMIGSYQELATPHATCAPCHTTPRTLHTLRAISALTLHSP